MSTAQDVRTHIDESVLADLDFNPICSVREVHRVFWIIHRIKPPCGDPAKWVALFPCCGHTMFTCHEHHSSTRGRYPHCGIPWATYHLTWSKI